VVLQFGSLSIIGAIAGCTTSLDDESTPPTSTTSLDDDSNSSPPATTSTSTEASQVIEYEDLNAQQQSAFKVALQNTVYFVPESSYINKPYKYDLDEATVFKEYNFVRYEGSLYDISLEPDQMYATYGIKTATGTPSNNATVAEFAQLPEGVREEVKTAIEAGEYYAPAGKWDSLPESLGDADYVRYDNSTYEMTYIYGDIPSKRMTAEKAE
jgi:hypothetical protein